MIFLRKIFSPLLLFLSVSMLVYAFYISEIHFEGVKRNYYIKYYIISIVFVLLSILSFYLNKSYKEYVIILTSSLVISLYSFEIYLHLKESKKFKDFYKKSRFEFLIDNKKKNKNFVINISPFNYLKFNNLQIFPLSGISNSETVNCNENGYFSTFKSDRYGFNNPDNEWDSKNIDFMIVGDSFVFGSCVNRPNDISSVLRKLSKKTVLNLGYDGNGPLIEYATLREYMSKNVKSVIWFYYEENDLAAETNGLELELKNNYLAQYLNDRNFSQNLTNRQSEVNKLALSLFDRFKDNELKKLNHSSKIKKNDFLNLKIIKILRLDYLRKIVLKSEKVFTISRPKPNNDFIKIIKLTKDLMIKNNSKLYFVYLPEFNRYNVNYDDSSYLKIKKIINKLNISFIDIHKLVFEKEKNPKKLFPYGNYGHYNELGYYKVSNAVYNYIISQNLSE